MTKAAPDTLDVLWEMIKENPMLPFTPEDVASGLLQQVAEHRGAPSASLRPGAFGYGWVCCVDGQHPSEHWGHTQEQAIRAAMRGGA